MEEKILEQPLLLLQLKVLLAPTAHRLTRLQDMDVLWYAGGKEETMTF